MWKLKNLEASHPRIAGIVQTHRQQIDAVHAGQQQADRQNIQKRTLTESNGKGKDARDGGVTRLRFSSAKPHPDPAGYQPG